MDTATYRLRDAQAFRDADTKFREGDHMTDAELALLITRYSAASEALRAVCHPSYRLVENDLYDSLQSLEGFQKARRER